MRCRTAVEGLDDVHAPAATRARMGGLVVCRGAIGSLLLLRFLRRAYRIDQFTRSRDGLGLGPTRQQPAVPDAVETVRQDVDEKSADELARVKRHALVAAGSLDPIVFVAERDAGRVGGDKAAAGDRDPVGCQSAFKIDPASASNFDPFGRRVLAVALAPSELVGVAETVRARAA